MRFHALAAVVPIALLATATAAPAREPWEGQPIYARALMSDEEVQQYRAEFEALRTIEEKGAYWQAHVERMQQRALERGVSPPDPPRKLLPLEQQRAFGRPPYFDEIMTEAEIEAYRETEVSLTDPVERRAFIADHIRRMQERGAARGISIPSTADWSDLLERTAADEASAGAAETAADDPDGATP